MTGLNPVQISQMTISTECFGNIFAEYPDISAFRTGHIQRNTIFSQR